MAYQAPATASERLEGLGELYNEFTNEYGLLVQKNKKISGHRARKALLSITKLARIIRQDINEVIAEISKPEKKEK
ncbi:MAG: hypothetical protein PHF86_02855 [Candidatus Nanoarchaeia archaeon]|jgi:hypothetical protein|nr:hypothetical protein [Candidatus Nanoarchaeia archaeon]